jgi:hypothetical protein
VQTYQAPVQTYQQAPVQTTQPPCGCVTTTNNYYYQNGSQEQESEQAEQNGPAQSQASASPAQKR